jgi:hypothetical protein
MDAKKRGDRADQSVRWAIAGLVSISMGIGIVVGDTVRKWLTRGEVESAWTICAQPKACDCSCRCEVECQELPPVWPEDRDWPKDVYEPDELSEP